jgi:hypothetical protein
VRHERPQGFIRVWPDLAQLRHSCAPNSSVVVVGKYALLHVLLWCVRRAPLMCGPTLRCCSTPFILTDLLCSYVSVSAACILFFCCQVRHERPQGFIGVWPDLALLRHSCAPNSSVVVVGKYALLHATADLDPGTEVTFNKLGR